MLFDALVSEVHGTAAKPWPDERGWAYMHSCQPSSMALPNARRIRCRRPVMQRHAV